MWERRRLLIWGKTYPEFSTKYYETVCTGAIDESGALVRIYPVTLRYMKEPFAKYQWIDAEIARNTSDRRPESYRIRQDTIRVGEELSVSSGGAKAKQRAWDERRARILRPEHIYASPWALRDRERTDGTSLGLVKPRTIKRIYTRWKTRADREEWEAHRERALAQRELFVDEESRTRDLQFVPLQYRIEFTAGDDGSETEHDMSVLDWEVYALHRKRYGMWAKETGDSREAGQNAESDVRAKLAEMLDPATKDPYFYLGNTLAHPQSFFIVGLFTPPAKKEPLQRALF